MIRKASLALVAAALATAAGVLLSASASAQDATITVGDTWFCSEDFQNGTCETTISVGDTVTWDFSGAELPHTTTSSDGVWDSDIIDDGSTFEHTFDEAGTYAYVCNVHPQNMAGTIFVEEDGEEPAPTDGDEPVDDTTDDTGNGATDDSGADVTPESAPTAGSGGPMDGGSTSGWLVAGMTALAGAVIAGAGIFAYRRAR
jgi:plastocyanin